MFHTDRKKGDKTLDKTQRKLYNTIVKQIRFTEFMKKDLTICRLNDVYGSLLTSKQTEMIRQFYDEDLSLGEIAENEGITRQAAHDAINKGTAALKNYEADLGFSFILDELYKINDSMDKEEILARIHSILDGSK